MRRKYPAVLTSERINVIKRFPDLASSFDTFIRLSRSNSMSVEFMKNGALIKFVPRPIPGDSNVRCLWMGDTGHSYVHFDDRDLTGPREDGMVNLRIRTSRWGDVEEIPYCFLKIPVEAADALMTQAEVQAVNAERDVIVRKRKGYRQDYVDKFKIEMETTLRTLLSAKNLDEAIPLLSDFLDARDRAVTSFDEAKLRWPEDSSLPARDGGSLVDLVVGLELGNERTAELEWLVVSHVIEKKTL
jgi:hypothetical protein